MSGYRKLGRPTPQRKALLRGLATQTLKHGKITTTLFRAKEAQRLVEKMITLGKKGDLHSRRLAARIIYENEIISKRQTGIEKKPRVNVLNKLFDEISPRYANREGGCTRIYKLGPRRGDGAEIAILTLVD